ncbi:transposase [Dactylosporangium fulvum]|uniref:transposase n=1 Tax=Dactylosporangium fulvum TaxID=53359 RepID=UPI003873822C
MRKGQQPPWIVPDGLWERIEPLLPVKTRSFRYPGRKPLPNRKVLCGILFVLYTGIQWEFLPVRREALCDRVGVRDLRRWPVAAG